VLLGRITSKYKTVIIIDDNDIDAYINKKMLQYSNLIDNEKIHLFLKPHDAIQFLKENINLIETPAIIFLDLNMEGNIDGFNFMQLLEDIQGDERKFSVAVITSSTDHADYEKSTKKPYVVDFIVKPVTIKNISDLFV
jgi:CheY-like chemotaxis protein